jgi:signal peptidase
MKKLLNSIFSLIATFLLLVAFFIVIFIIGSKINLIGQFHSFVVLSGSMEPTIFIGDIVITKKQDDYRKNDVITFYGPEGRIVTHRIVEIKENKDHRTFFTKGDANRSEDDAQIQQEQIIGKVIFVIPKLGYAANFIQTPLGLIILVFIPSSLLIFDQLLKIFR